ncbi:MAG: DUF4339 domain-containing protein [Puniceicoccaceae bacterium]|nr:MAG: DUF4339 domain-containing protein [Puniceicoccaceae bacterium]
MCLFQAKISGKIMSDYYIRTPDQDESRGPFDAAKLQTLAEAGQVTPNTLFYDEEKEEWIPLALNKELHAQVFPEREKLTLKINQATAKPSKKKVEPAGLEVGKMLAAAEGDTQEKRQLIRRRKSLEKAATMAPNGLGAMMLLSALFMILPLVPEIESSFGKDGLAAALKYPAVLIGIFDLLMGVLLLLSVTGVYPLVRGRAMLGLGFGVYVGWAIGDPGLMALTATASLGLFMATLANRFGTLVFALILGIGGHAYLAYLALSGRFDGFFESIFLSF